MSAPAADANNSAAQGTQPAEPAKDGAAQPAAAAEPAKDGAAQPAAEPAKDGAAQPAAEPAKDGAAQPAAEPAKDGAAQPAAEPAKDGAATEAPPKPTPEEEEIKRLEAEVAEEQKLLDAAQADHDKAVADFKAEREKVNADLKKQLEEAKKEDTAASDELTRIAPEYDRAEQQKDILERHNACKRDLDDVEKRLADQQSANTDLEKKLESVSADYKNMRDARANVVRNSLDVLKQTQDSVTNKIAQTIEAEEIVSLEAFNVLELLSDLVTSREREIHNNQRLLREISEIVKLKEETADKLEKDSQKAIDDKRRERAEAVKRIVYAFQDERNTLQADVEEVRRVNAEQTGSLTRGHVDKKVKDPVLFRPELVRVTPSGRRESTKRITAPRQDPTLTPEQQLVSDKNAEVERELHETLQQVQDALKHKTELAKSQKQVKMQISIDRADTENKLRELEAQVVSEVERVRKLNLENARLADAVKHLTDVVRTTKHHVERIRGHTAALPIEAD